jgi:hypothetical protein
VAVGRRLLAALLGKDAPGLSAMTIARLKEVWIDEHKRWSERDLSAKSYVYVWADGVYLQALHAGRLRDPRNEVHNRLLRCAVVPGCQGIKRRAVA